MTRTVYGRWVGIFSGLIFCCAFAAHAQPRDPSLFIGETGFPPGDILQYQFSAAPGPAGSPTIIDQAEEGQFIVAESSVDVWSVRERASIFNLSAPVKIADTGLSVPETLSTVEAGGAYGRHLNNGNSFGVNLGVGSASDRLFNSIHETTLRTSVNYRLPTTPGRAWLLFITYSNNRNFNNGIPLPGFAYSIDSPAAHVKAILGYPFIALVYTPLAKWEGRLALFGPRRLSAEIGYKIAGPIQTYGRFEWGSQQWLLADRQNNDDQLFFDQKRWLVGVRSPVPHGLLLDTSVGREFNRRFFENTSSSYRNISTETLPSAWYMDARISWRFHTKQEIK